MCRINPFFALLQKLKHAFSDERIKSGVGLFPLRPCPMITWQLEVVGA